MSDVVLKDQYGNDVTYSNVNAVLLNTVDGGTATYVSEGSSSNLLYDKYESVTMLELTDQSFEIVDDEDSSYCIFSIEEFDSSIETAWNKFVYANVSWDGVNYVVKPQTVSIPADGGMISPTYIGNGVLFKELGAVDTGEPFLIFAGTEISDDGTFVCQIGGCLNSTEELAEGSHTHTVSVELVLVDEKKIKPEYIEQSDWEETDTSAASYIKNKPFGEVVDETILNCVFTNIKNSDGEWENICGYEDPSDVALIENEKYKVLWDGIEYTCTCAKLQGLLCIGNILGVFGIIDSGEPFLIIRDPNGILFESEVGVWIAEILDETSDNGEHTCVISCEHTTKVDPSLLRLSDWNETSASSGAYINHKPFYTTPALTILANNVTVNCTNELGSIGYYGEIEPFDCVPGGGYMVVLDGSYYEAIGAEQDMDGICVVTLLQFGTDEEDEDTGGMIVQNMFGVNGLVVKEPGEHTFSVIAINECVKKIDKKYIPEIDSLPSVTTSDNDKTLTVVDGAWAVTNPAKGVPEVTTSDNGKFLRVVDGVWAAATVENAEEVGF